MADIPESDIENLLNRSDERSKDKRSATDRFRTVKGAYQAVKKATGWAKQVSASGGPGATVAIGCLALILLLVGAVMIMGIGVSLYGKFFRGLAIQNSGGPDVSSTVGGNTGSNSGSGSGTNGTGSNGGQGAGGGSGTVEGNDGGVTGDTNGEATVETIPISTGSKLYAKFYVPLGADCVTVSGEIQFKSTESSSLVPCQRTTDSQRNENKFNLGIVLGNKFYPGVVAVNDQTTWNNGTVWPVNTQAVNNSNTYWLYIPGYFNPASGTPTQGVPVVANMSAQETEANRKVDGVLGKDMTYRVNLAVATEQVRQNIIKNLKQAGNCRNEVGKLYDCEITGVTTKFGRMRQSTAVENTGYAENDSVCVNGKCSTGGSSGGGSGGTPSNTPPVTVNTTGSGIGVKIAGIALGQVGQPSSNYSRGGQPWCAFFVSDTLASAGVQNIKGMGAVNSLKSWFEGQQQLISASSGAPKVGDVVFFSAYRHVGIVVAINGDVVHTVEGNVGDGAAVYQRKYKLSNAPFSHYGRIVTKYN